MKRPENDRWLDEALTETIGSEKPRTDFDAWKQNHPQAVQMLTARANRQTSVAVRSFSLRNTIMKSPLTKLAVAAIVIIACVIGLSVWRTTGSGIALADVLARVEQIKAYRFKSSQQSWSEKVTGEDPNKRFNFRETRSTSLTSQEYDTKNKVINPDPNGGESTFKEVYIFPEKKTMIHILHKQKKYVRIELDDVFMEHIWQVTDPRTWIKRMLKYKYESMGRSTVDGIEVEGFQTTDPNFFYFEGRKTCQIDVKMWVDVKTRLPVRYDSTYAYFDQMEDKIIEHVHFVMHDFQWDVPVDAAEFKPVIPDDYTGTVIKYPAHITEETVIQGLKLLVELLGKYPENIYAVDDTGLWYAKKSETPAAMRLKEEIKGLTEDEIGNKLVDFLMPIRGVAMFYGLLQGDKKDPAYYGETVTPKDADKVLMRWKVSDNEYRVIYGDLHTETVSSDKLAELEKALPK
jgi:hypothetical protein